MSRFGFSVPKNATIQKPVARKQKSCQPMSRLPKRSSWSYMDGSSVHGNHGYQNPSSGSDSAYWSLNDDVHHLSLRKRSSKLRAPTQSITNGDRTDNSSESGSIRGGHSSSRERSRSREGSRERERRRDHASRDRDDPRDHDAHDAHDPRSEPTYGVIKTQPRSKGKHPIPRRHTVGGSALATGTMKAETERSKDAFMDMLASRYPQYAEKISSTASEDGFPVRGRSRDPRRRATVAYNPLYNRSLDYEGTMSEVDGPTFNRGAFVRSSLPPSSARSPPSTLDKPPGLVFLIFRDETKKALLPNEITHLDTVRAMFVRSFPGKLTMSYLESPKRKVYILDPRTNIYYQLEDLRDIKDRTVLRVHECDSHEPQRVLEKPEVRGRTVHMPPAGPQGYYGSSPSSAITSQVQKAQTFPQHMQQPIYMSYDNVTQSPVRTSYERSRSLTPDPSRSANYAQNPIYGRMGISPERPPPQDGSVPPDRPPTLRPIPEHYQMINGNKNGARLVYGYVNGQQYQQASGAPSPSSSQRSYPRQAMSPPAIPTGPRIDPGRRAFSPPPNLQNYDYIQVVTGSQASPAGPPPYSGYVAKGVRASTVVTPQRTSVAPSPGQPQAPVPSQTSWRERSPVGRQTMPLTAAPYGVPSSSQQRSQSYRVPPTQERDSLLITRPRSMTPSPIENEMTRDRIDKMEHQLASLAAWVQSAVVQSASSTGAPSSGQGASSTASVTSDTSPLLDSASCKVDSEPTGFVEVKGLSDLASEATATLSQDMREKIIAIKHQADALRLDLRNLRRLQQINKESMIETVDNAWRKIKEAIATVPGAESLLIRQQRNELDVMYQIYLEDKARTDKELLDLEHAVEELRSDVLSRQCRVQMSDVEGMALVLSHVTKALGELKIRFPKLMDTMKHLMSAEMEVIVNEEKFLKEEPEKIDNSLKKCKKLTGTLFTLKRLASVQEHRPPQPIAMTAQAKIPTNEDKKAILENIQAMIPDHKARIHGIEAAEASRERKKKITTQQEALRFGKSLELATKALKSSSQPGAASANISSRGKSSASAQPSSTDCVPTTSTPKSSSSSHDTSSVISFAIPMSTSTPKSANQPPPTSHIGDSSSTSPSISYPVMSLMKAVQGNEQKDKVQRYYDRGDDVRDKGHRYHDKPSGRTSKSVEFKSEPAILPVTSSESVASKTGKKEDQVSVATSAESPSLSEQKMAARAAFFSSLSSPVTPTTSTGPIVTMSMPSTDSPTELYSRRSPGVNVSPIRGIPSLVRSTAVTVPPTLISTSVTQTSIPKPSSLPMSGHSASSTSLVSTQKFSPASPNHGGSAIPSKSRSSFTAIPKPSSPTKSSTPSPLTPESPKYRVPPSQLSSEGGRKMHLGTGAKPKKIPPPPPPRKSSKLPETAVLAVNAATVNGQLAKSLDKQKAESSKSKDSRKSLSDVIDPPKQFANLDTKVERKSSVGSLKQFTTPLLESKRDLQWEKQSKLKQSPLASKKISSSNLDSETMSSKKHSKEIDIGKDEKSLVQDIDDTVIEGKVTNIPSRTWSSSREGSLDSSGSSASGDSQYDVWQKRLGESIETAITDTTTGEDDTGHTEPVVTGDSGHKEPNVTRDTGHTEANVTDKEQTRSSDGGKKPKPPPPQRRSSLSSKPQTEESESGDKKEGPQSKVIDRLV